MNDAYEIGLWVFALSGWFAAFCVATTHQQIVARVLDSLSGRESAWRERADKLGETESGIYADGYASGLREAQEIIHRQTKPPKRRRPKLATTGGT